MTTMAKLSGLVDARSSQGVFSRGKPVYRGGLNSPKAGLPDKRKAIQKAAKRRLKGYAK